MMVTEELHVSTKKFLTNTLTENRALAAWVGQMPVFKNFLNKQWKSINFLFIIVDIYILKSATKYFEPILFLHFWYFLYKVVSVYKFVIIS